VTFGTDTRVVVPDGPGHAAQVSEVSARDAGSTEVPGMRTLVVYESMDGNTHSIAEAIAEGLRSHGEAQVVSTGGVTDALLGSADLLVAGGPTHVHGMARETTRTGARDTAAKPGSARARCSSRAACRAWARTFSPARKAKVPGPTSPPRRRK